MRKIIRWGTPRKANPKYEKYDHAPGISKWKCKKNRGKHFLVFVKKHRSLFGEKWNEFICSVCGKKISENIEE
ncbi:MAG: hypothetical protein WA055_04845 [Candidatus Moraniibacteriota bacterium]